jgi:hypothetical protein
VYFWVDDVPKQRPSHIPPPQNYPLASCVEAIPITEYSDWFANRLQTDSNCKNKQPPTGQVYFQSWSGAAGRCRAALDQSCTAAAPQKSRAALQVRNSCDAGTLNILAGALMT